MIGFRNTKNRFKELRGKQPPFLYAKKRTPISWDWILVAEADQQVGPAMTKLAALKNDSDRGGSPVANMWCTQTPKPRSMVETVAMATSV